MGIRKEDLDILTYIFRPFLIVLSFMSILNLVGVNGISSEKPTLFLAAVAIVIVVYLMIAQKKIT